MDAGLALTVSGPLGTKQMTMEEGALFPDDYGADFGGFATEPTTPDFLEPGTYAINNGTGGPSPNHPLCNPIVEPSISPRPCLPI